MLKEIKQLAMMGASVILLHERSKRPIGKNWSKKPRLTWDELQEQYEDGMNLGIRLGEWSVIDGMFLHVLDVDIRHPKEKPEAFSELKRLLPGVDLTKLPCVRSGSGGESFHLYFVTDVPYTGKTLAKSGRLIPGEDGKDHQSWEIDLFGTGKQVASPPSIHPVSGKPYVWEREFDPDAKLPYISDQIIEAIVNPRRDEGPFDAEAVEISYEEVEERLEYLDLDPWCVHRPYWLRLGMALHHNFGGEKAAFELWCKFSKQIPEKFNRADAWKDWKSFDDGKTERPFTLRTILKETNEAMRRAELMADVAAMDRIDPDEPKPLTRAEQRALKDEFPDLVEPADTPKQVMAHHDDPNMVILRQVRHKSPEFPLHIFSSFWQRETQALATNSAAPIDYAAATILTTIASITGNARWANPLGRWHEPPTMWTQIIGPPSANKSPAIRPYMNMIHEIEASWEPEHKEEKRLWQSKKKKADALRKQWEIRMAAALEKGDDVGDMPADCIAPPEPARRRALIGDATLEAMVRQMAVNPRGFLNYRDEMAGWYANMSRYGGAGATDRPAWLEAYGGGIYTVDRVKDGGEPISVHKFNVSIIGGIQPEPLLAMASSAEDGLQARFMPFWPEKAKRKLYRGEPLELKGKFALEALSELRMKKDKTTGLWEPVIVPFSDEARTVFADWEDDRKDREEHVPSKLENTFGKARGHVARIALLLELMNWAEDPFDDRVSGPEEVSVDSVRKAIDFRENYLKHMQMRVFGFTGESEVARMAKAIAEWVVHNEIEHFRVRQLKREGGIPGITSRTTNEQIEEALGYLVSLRWLFIEEPQGRGRPSPKYVVNERLWPLVNK